MQAVGDQGWIVILNPASGSSDEGYREALEAALSESGAQYEIRETTPERDGKTLAGEALKEGARQFLACGGDGTVMAVINGLGAESGATLGIVPGGTANLVAAALKVPTDTAEAVATAMRGRDRKIDLGRSGETLFALGIGIGLTERLVSEASTEAKEKIGRWAYLLALLKELGARPHRFTLKLDEKEIQEVGVALVIANAGEIGGGMRFAPDAKLDDGLLDVCILHRFNFSDAVRLAWKTLTGGLRDERLLSFHQAKRVEIAANPPLEVQIDGETVEAKTPIEAESVAGALTVRVPAEEPASA